MASSDKSKKKKSGSSSKSSRLAGMFASSERKDKTGRIVAIILIVAMIGFTFITAGLFLLD